MNQTMTYDPRPQSATVNMFPEYYFLIEFKNGEEIVHRKGSAIDYRIKTPPESYGRVCKVVAVPENDYGPRFAILIPDGNNRPLFFRRCSQPVGGQPSVDMVVVGWQDLDTKVKTLTGIESNGDIRSWVE